MMRNIFLLMAMLAVLVGCGHQSPSGQQKVLQFTAVPDQNTAELIQRFAPFTEYLSHELAVKVEYVPSRDYQASVEMFRKGEVQLAWFGGLTGVQARSAVPGAVAIAQGAADPEYYSYIIANAATGLQRGKDFPLGIRDLSFTFGSPSSTSGRLMPEYFLREATGLAPAEFFSNLVGFSGSHDKTCELVAAGRFQIGAVNYRVYDQRVAAGKTDPEVCRVIWQTPTFADYNFTAHPSLDEIFGEGFIARLQEVLIGISDPTLLAALPRKKLIPVSNGQYAGIENVARELGMIPRQEPSRNGL